MHDTVNIDFEKTVCAEGDLQNTDNDDYVEIEDSMLDIDEALIEDMILNFPLKILCDEDCKGLCPKCGIDLNTGSCSCVTKEIDPRLAVLLKLFRFHKIRGFAKKIHKNSKKLLQNPKKCCIILSSMRITVKEVSINGSTEEESLQGET